MTHTTAQTGQTARPNTYNTSLDNPPCSKTTEDPKFIYVTFTPGASDECLHHPSTLRLVNGHDILNDDGNEDPTSYDNLDYNVSKKVLAPFLMVLNSNMPGMPQVKSCRRRT